MIREVTLENFKDIIKLDVNTSQTILEFADCMGREVYKLDWSPHTSGSQDWAFYSIEGTGRRLTSRKGKLDVIGYCLGEDFHRVMYSVDNVDELLLLLNNKASLFLKGGKL